MKSLAIILLVLLVWGMGLLAFAARVAHSTPAPEPPKAEGLVVLTGMSSQRIEEGMHLLREGKAQRMLVSGVNLTVHPRDFKIMFRVSPRLFACCVDLGRDAVDTRSNGEESAAWVKKNGYRSIRLITTDWHMPRAYFELRQALPKNVSIIRDAVRSEPDLRILLTEYHKYLLRRAAALFGI